MSVQTKITTRKSGKETKRYYATVYDAVAKNPYAVPSAKNVRRHLLMSRKSGAKWKCREMTVYPAKRNTKP